VRVCVSIKEVNLLSEQKSTRTAQPIQRRRFLKYAGGAVAAAALVGAGYYAYQATRPPPKPASIRILEFNHYEDQPKSFIADFEAKTGVKVEMESITAKDTRDKLLTAHRAGSSAWDVVPLWATVTKEMAHRKWLVDITDRCKDYFGKVEDDLPGGWDGFFEPAMLSGRIYAVPDKIGGPILMWNKKILKDRGLDPERPYEWYKIPNSIDEFVEYAKACTFVENGVEHWGYVDQWGYEANVEFDIFLQMFGGKLLDLTKNPPWGEPLMNSAECVAALQWMVDLMNKHKAVDPASPTYNWCFDQFPPFFTGRVAFTITWPFGYGLAEDPTQSKIAGNTAFALNFAKKTTATTDGSEFEGVSVYAPHGIDWGWEWLKHKTSKEMMAKQNQSAWMSIYASQIAESPLPFAKTVLESWKYPHSGFFAADNEALIGIIDDEIHAALRMDKKSQDAMDSCVGRINDLRKTYT
jgi:multiple sugar transport system substrate-binding protein